MVYFTASILMMLMLVDQILAGVNCNIPEGASHGYCSFSGITSPQGITGDVTNLQVL